MSWINYQWRKIQKKNSFKQSGCRKTENNLENKICLKSKIRLVRILAHSIIKDTFESWTLTSELPQRIQVSEMKHPRYLRRRPHHTWHSTRRHQRRNRSIGRIHNQWWFFFRFFFFFSYCNFLLILKTHLVFIISTGIIFRFGLFYGMSISSRLFMPSFIILINNRRVDIGLACTRVKRVDMALANTTVKRVDMGLANTTVKRLDMSLACTWVK